MAKEQFREKLRLSRANIERLDIVNEIIEEYRLDGYTLTLRQLYYQLVSRDIIPNKDSEYKKISSLLTKGRMGGVVDWEAIEDRIRKPILDYAVDGIEQALDDTIEQYKLRRQDGQNYYIELWVEKDALSGVLRRITDYYHIRLMVNRGYSSCTALHDAYKRFDRAYDRGQQGVILYLGDHDPSGLDMIRDIGDRLAEFGVEPEIRHIGLTMEQIRQYDPPTNPAKITDPRAKWYIKKHGDKSWEVDALNPKILHELVSENVNELIDMSLFKEKIDQEEIDKVEIHNLISKNEE